MNCVQLIGNLTRDVEMSETPTGVSLAKFTIAINRPYSVGKKKTVDYFNIIAWTTLGENCCKYLSKGSKVGVHGRLENNSYKDKGGYTCIITNIVAEQVEFLSTRRDVGKSGEHNDSRFSQGQQLDAFDDTDGLPF